MERLYNDNVDKQILKSFDDNSAFSFLAYCVTTTERASSNMCIILSSHKTFVGNTEHKIVHMLCAHVCAPYFQRNF